MTIQLVSLGFPSPVVSRSRRFENSRPAIGRMSLWGPEGGRRTLGAKELARDVERLAADNDNLLAIQELLGNDASKTAEQVALAIDDNLSDIVVSFGSRLKVPLPCGGDGTGRTPRQLGDTAKCWPSVPLGAGLSLERRRPSCHGAKSRQAIDGQLTTGSKDDIVLAPGVAEGGNEGKSAAQTTTTKNRQVLKPSRRETAAVLLGLVVPRRGCW